MKQFLSMVLAVFLVQHAHAQYGKVAVDSKFTPCQVVKPTIPTPDQAEFIGFRNPPSDDLNFLPTLMKVSENENENQEELEQLKEKKTRYKFSYAPNTSSSSKTTAPTAPVLGTNFAGVDNGGGSTPLDNTIAISNGGIIVAMINSKVTYYNTSGAATATYNIYNLIGDVTLTNNVCDPKVIYDNVADRFIFYTQICDAVVSHSKVIIGFSKTNNPSAGWYFYKFTGNPLSDNSWFDYPKLGISNDELFVTGNLFKGTTNAFNQSVVYQIQKGPLYAGAATPTWRYYSGLSGAFTICPASYGLSGSYGPGIYLVTNTGAGGFGGGGNVRLYDITTNIAGSPSIVGYNVNTAAYSAPGNAAQQGTSWQLNTGDYRILDAFFLRGTVHYVYNKDIGSGWSGVSYNRLSVTSLTNTNADLGNLGVSDLAFGALASSAIDSNDKSVVIAFNQSASTYYPRTCAVKVDGSMQFSPILVVKAGLGYIHYSFVTSGSERWGDYNGLCKKYNDVPSTVWMAGMYGNTSHYWNQWIAKLNAPTNAVEIQETSNNNLSVFPNPVRDFYNVRFESSKRQKIDIQIVDMAGKVVVNLYSGIIEEGENMFSFNKANLAPGLYLMNIVGESNVIKHEKITVSEN